MSFMGKTPAEPVEGDYLRHRSACLKRIPLGGHCFPTITRCCKGIKRNRGNSLLKVPFSLKICSVAADDYTTTNETGCRRPLACKVIVMGQRIVRAVKELSRDLHVEVVTPEYEIVLTLFGAGCLSAEALGETSSLSRSGFFRALGRLRHYSIVTCETNDDDRRFRIYELSSLASDVLSNSVIQFSHSQMVLDFILLCGGDALDACRGAAASPAVAGHLQFLTSEFQIMHYLRWAPGASNGELSSAITSSTTRFHQAVNLLISRNLLLRQKCGADARRTRYYLPPEACFTIERKNRALFSWLNNIRPLTERVFDPVTA